MKNKLTDLNNHLFAQLERLNDEDITTEDLEHEILRSKSVSDISSQIIANARVQLDAMKSIGTPENSHIKHLLGDGSEK